MRIHHGNAIGETGATTADTLEGAYNFFSCCLRLYRLLRGRYAAGSRHKGRNFSRAKLWVRSMPISRGVVLVSFSVHTRPFVFSVAPINSSPFGARSVGEKRIFIILFRSDIPWLHIKRPKVLDGVTRARSRIITYSCTFYRICKWRSCLQRAIGDNGRSGQNVFRNLHDSVAVLRVSSRHESRDAAIRFPRMSNWALTRWENCPCNTRRRKTTNVKC
ncbi:hypothetical protein ALC57_16771 [Trachymyrmex cornetzi]|uniref:Uncharacterized protein n=1 Tax=Trachymyrmex cornetzi TaxID=471704 RepID=A0A151IUP5_9HYME|nr:hypothetical protein ALC57_16771 [Trachymyrmex cornetzi]